MSATAGPTVLVTAASVSDTAAGVQMLSRIATRHPRVTKAWMDAGYRTTAIDRGARLGIDVHPVLPPPGVNASCAARHVFFPVPSGPP